jgi:hypothetical protein
MREELDIVLGGRLEICKERLSAPPQRSWKIVPASLDEGFSHTAADG